MVIAMQKPDRTKNPPAANESEPPARRKPEAVPTVPAPSLDEDYAWDPERDPAEGLDPATAWWGG